MASSLRGVVYPDSPRRRTRRPRAGECGIVNAMPVRRTPLHGGVLVHRRHDDAIAQGQRPQPKGREQIEPVHVLGGRPHLSHGDVDLRGRIPPPDPATPIREVRGTRYYTNAVHRAAFVLPPFLKDLIREDRCGDLENSR